MGVPWKEWPQGASRNVVQLSTRRLLLQIRSQPHLLSDGEAGSGPTRDITRQARHSELARAERALLERGRDAYRGFYRVPPVVRCAHGPARGELRRGLPLQNGAPLEACCSSCSARAYRPIHCAALSYVSPHPSFSLSRVHSRERRLICICTFAFATPRASQVRLSGWHAKHSSVLELGAVPVSPSSACLMRLSHRARQVDTSPNAVDTPFSRRASGQASGSKFKVLSVIVPPFDMNRRSITDLKNGEVSIEGTA